MFPEHFAGESACARWYVKREQPAQLRLPTAVPPPSETANGYETGEIPTRAARRRSNLDPRDARYWGGPRKPYQRVPDGARERRRQLAWRPNAMPDRMRMQLTESERAYANLVREDHERQGYFDRCHDEAAALIGCSAKTVQRAQQRLASPELGWIVVDRRPQPGRQKHLPNIVRIVSREWLTWIARGPRKAASIESGHSCPATQSESKQGSSFANSVPVSREGKRSARVESRKFQATIA